MFLRRRVPPTRIRRRSQMPEPRIRTARRGYGVHKLNDLSRDVLLSIGKSLTYYRLLRGDGGLAGEEWERIFAKAVGGTWEKSNVGLEDVVKGSTCWGAKTVKCSNPYGQQVIRLIVGRNSLDYSLGISDPRSHDPQEVGTGVLAIWNMRVNTVGSKFHDMRFAILVRSDTLEENAIFEDDVRVVDPREVEWRWNKRSNLEGWAGGSHLFTWQPHGSQFTMIRQVPPKVHKVRLRLPANVRTLDEESLLAGVGWSEEWVIVE